MRPAAPATSPSPPRSPTTRRPASRPRPSSTQTPKKKNGWAVGGATGKPHTLTLLPAAGVDVPAGSKLVVTIEQQSPQANHTLGHFRLGVTDEAGVAESARLPAAVLAALGDRRRQADDRRRRTRSAITTSATSPRS